MLYTKTRRNYMNYSDAIKDLRKKNLLSQTDFAKEIGVSFSTVNRWETGKSKPNYRALKRIDEYCKAKSVDFVCSKLIEEDE